MTSKEDQIAIDQIETGLENQIKKPVEALDDDPEFTYTEQRKIIHRLDRRLITMTGMIYCAALIDRGGRE
jgi:hypothetical protein